MLYVVMRTVYSPNKIFQDKTFQVLVFITDDSELSRKPTHGAASFKLSFDNFSFNNLKLLRSKS
jgi:hypothetical protein